MEETKKEHARHISVDEIKTMIKAGDGKLLLCIPVLNLQPPATRLYSHHLVQICLKIFFIEEILHKKMQ